MKLTPRYLNLGQLLSKKSFLLIEEENIDHQSVIVIDEIQKIPSLLDEVHRLIEKHQWHFLLTGSSARKLKRGAANLQGLSG